MCLTKDDVIRGRGRLTLVTFLATLTPIQAPHPLPFPQKRFNLHWREAEANLRSNEVITELPRLRM